MIKKEHDDTIPVVKSNETRPRTQYNRSNLERETPKDVTIDEGPNLKKNITTVKINFKEPSELYEIKLRDKYEFDKDKKTKKRSIFRSIRFYVMLITLISPIVSTYSKNIINFTILRMIDPECVKNESERAVNATVYYFETDNSCPVNDLDRIRLIEGLSKANYDASDLVGEKFKWDERQQGWLKAAFSIGHIPLQVAGSRFAETYSAHRVLTLSILLTAVFSFLAPFMATIGYYMLFIDLFLLGIVGSFITPSLMTLFSNWLTPGEKSVMLTSYLITSRIGSTLTSSICGFFLEKNLSWRYIFFSAGGANLFFVLVFFCFATSRPVEHRLISDEEVQYLATKNTLVRESLDELKTKNGNKELDIIVSNRNIQVAKPPQLSKSNITEKKSKSPPWKAILTSVPVWSFVITKFCVKLSGDLVSIELPAYLDRVMHFSGADNGAVGSWNYIIFCVGCFVAGSLSKIAVKKKPFGFSKTTIRKIFQFFASMGVSMLILGMAFNICDRTVTVILLFLWHFVTTFGTGGEQQIPLDITERYPGTIHAIASSLAISGVVVPVAVGSFLKGHPADQDRWRWIWYTASSVAAFGGIVFLLGADASIQPFDSMNGDEEEENDRKNTNQEVATYENNAYEKDIHDGKVEALVTTNYRESKQI